MSRLTEANLDSRKTAEDRRIDELIERSELLGSLLKQVDSALQADAQAEPPPPTGSALPGTASSRVSTAAVRTAAPSAVATSESSQVWQAPVELIQYTGVQSNTAHLPRLRRKQLDSTVGSLLRHDE